MCQFRNEADHSEVDYQNSFYFNTDHDKQNKVDTTAYTSSHGHHSLPVPVFKYQSCALCAQRLSPPSSCYAEDASSKTEELPGVPDMLRDVAAFDPCRSGRRGLL